MATDLILFEQALAIVLANAPDPEPETVAIEEALGRIAIDDAIAMCDLPAFDNSAVDGYAISQAAMERINKSGCAEFEVCGEIAAGSGQSVDRLGADEAWRIFTGAPVPEATCSVVMQEQAVRAECKVELRGPVRSGEHIRRQGEDIASHTNIALKGRRLGPADIGALAATGNATVDVVRRPLVAIIGTGDELRKPGQSLSQGQIYESNTYSLQAALKEMDCVVQSCVTSPDDPGVLRNSFQSALESCDVLLVSGGVSVGDRDYVRSTLQDLGVEELVWRVALKPGKPFYFGRRGRCRVLGLPGNPVSSLVTLFAFGRPFVKASFGLDPAHKVVRLQLADDIHKQPGRLELVPAIRDGKKVLPLHKRASHKPVLLSQADSLIYMPRDQASLKAGDTVDTLVFDWRIGK